MKTLEQIIAGTQNKIADQLDALIDQPEASWETAPEDEEVSDWIKIAEQNPGVTRPWENVPKKSRESRRVEDNDSCDGCVL